MIFETLRKMDAFNELSPEGRYALFDSLDTPEVRKKLKENKGMQDSEIDFMFRTGRERLKYGIKGGDERVEKEAIQQPWIDPTDLVVAPVSGVAGAGRAGTKAVLSALGKSTEGIGREVGYHVVSNAAGSVLTGIVGDRVEENLGAKDHPVLATMLPLAAGIASAKYFEPRIDQAIDSAVDVVKGVNKGSIRKSASTIFGKITGENKSLADQKRTALLNQEFKKAYLGDKSIYNIGPSMDAMDNQREYDNFSKNFIKAYSGESGAVPELDIPTIAQQTGTTEDKARLFYKKFITERYEAGKARAEAITTNAKKAEQERLDVLKTGASKSCAKAIDKVKPDQVILFGEDTDITGTKVLFEVDKDGFLDTGKLMGAIDNGREVYTSGKSFLDEKLYEFGYAKNKNGKWFKSRKATEFTVNTNLARIRIRAAKSKRLYNTLRQNGIDPERISDKEIVGHVIKFQNNAYASLKPGISQESYQKVRGVIEELEDILEPARRHRPKVTATRLRKMLRKAVKEGKIPKELQSGYRAFFRSLKKYPDIAVYTEGFGDMGHSGYRPFFNDVFLNDPEDLVHEVGHWAWYNILTKEDRLGFLDMVYKNYNSRKAWNTIFPYRLGRLRADKKRLEAGEITEEIFKKNSDWALNPKELFAEIIQSHAFTNVMPKEIQTGYIQRSKAIIRSFFRNVLKKNYNVPEDLRPFVDKAFKAEFTPSYFGDNNRIMNAVKRSAFYISKEEFDPETGSGNAYIDALVRNDRDALTVLEHLKLGLMPDGEEKAALMLKDTFTQMREAGMDADEVFYSILENADRASFDLASMLSSFQVNMMKWAHGIDSGVDEKALDEANEFFHELFKPQNREKLRSFIRLERGKRVVTSNGGDTDIGTGMQKSQAELDAEARAFASENRQQNYMEQSAEEANIRALTREAEELDALYTALKIEKSGETLPNMPTRKRQALELAISKLADERVPMPKNESPFSTIKIANQIAPQLTSLSMGITFDDEDGVLIPYTGVRIGWDANAWLTNYGGIGPMISALSLFGPRGKRLMGKYTKKGREKFLFAMKNFDQIHKNNFYYNAAKGVVNAFHPNEGMSREVAAQLRKMRTDASTVQRKVNETAEFINKNFSRTERIQMAEFIEQNGDFDLSNVSENVKKQAKVVQNLFADIREKLIDAGFPREELEKYGDNYLMRLYTTKRGKLKKTSFEAEQRRNMWKKITGSYLMQRGMKVTIDNTEHKDLKVGDVLFGQPKMKADGSWGIEWSKTKSGGAVEYRVTKNKGKKITFQRDYTRQERAELGEITDIVPRMVEFGKLVTRDVALAKMFRATSELTDHVMDKKAIKALAKERLMDPLGIMDELRLKGWQVVPDTKIKGTEIKRFGMLAGKFVSPDVMKALKMSTGELPKNPVTKEAIDKYRKVFRIWKIGKTAFNPATHGRNWICNCAICTVEGMNPVSIIANGAKHLRDKSDIFRRAIEAGMLDSNMIRSELDLDGFMRGVENIKDNDPNMVIKLLNASLTVPKKAARGALRSYELGDEIFKMGVFAREVANGKTDAEAIAKAKSMFFDYRDVPSGVRWLRDSGVVPFISYQYKIAGWLANIAKTRPWALAALIGAHEMADNFMYQVHYGKNAQGEEKLQEEVKPDWFGNKPYGFGPRSNINLGEYGEDNKYSLQLDYSSSIPGGDIGNIMEGFPFGTNPVVSIAYGLFAGKDANLEKQFKHTFNSDKKFMEEDNVDAIKERVAFIANNLLPNLPYPGSYSYDKLGNALVAAGVIKPNDSWNGKDYWGNDASLTEELVNFSGIGKLRRLYVEGEINRKQQMLMSSLRAKQARTKSLAKSGRTTEAMLEGSVKNYEAEAEWVDKELTRLGQMVEEAGR